MGLTGQGRVGEGQSAFNPGLTPHPTTHQLHPQPFFMPRFPRLSSEEEPLAPQTPWPDRLSRTLGNDLPRPNSQGCSEDDPRGPLPAAAVSPPVSSVGTVATEDPGKLCPRPGRGHAQTDCGKEGPRLRAPGTGLGDGWLVGTRAWDADWLSR